MTPGELLRDRRLVICVGAGGVGKTTVAAAVGLRAARDGRKVLVLTIDPAKRLANALGLHEFGNDETPIELGGPPNGGELWAMMLDNRAAADDLIRRLAPDDATRDGILGNRIYRAIADNIAGSQDYMATEKLYDVVHSGRYDLVVLDTPPAKNALDFLDAPGRLARFLDRRIMRWFLTPYEEGRVFGRLLLGTSAVVFRLLGYVFGREFLAELSGFFLYFRDLYDGFRERHEAVLALFRDRGTAFVIVAAPTEPALEVAEFFLGELRARRMPNPGVIVNQRHFAHADDVDAADVLGERAWRLAADLAPHTAGRLLARLGAAHRRLRELSRTEERLQARFERRLLADQHLWLVPRLPAEVHDLGNLDRVGRWLFDGGDALGGPRGAGPSPSC